MIRFALLVALALAPPARANPAQDLLRRVPPESTLCFVAQDGKGHAERIAASPFLAKLKASDLGKSLLNPDAMEKVFALEKVLADSLHLTAAQLRDDVLGDAVVYAYRPGATGKPDEDAGLILVKPRRPQTLAKLIDDYNAVQKESGELKGVAEKALGKRAYFRREMADGTGEFYFFTEGVFAFSKDERLVVAALDAAPKATPFLDAYNRLGLSKAALAAIFQPRLLDANLKAKIAATDNAHAKAFLAQFGRIWGSTAAVALSVELGTDVELALHASFDPKTLPAEVKPFLGARQGSALWPMIPKDALLALAGRLDLPQFLRLGKTFLSEPGLQGLRHLLESQIAPAVGKDDLPALLKGLGPDWALWLTPPGKAAAGALPELTVAIRVRGADGEGNALGDALRAGFGFAFQMFRVEYNKAHDDQFKIRDTKDGAGSIQHLENAKRLPAGVRPAFGQRGDFFLLASSPEAIRRFDPTKDAPTADAGVFLRVGWAGLDQYLRAHGDAFAELFAGLAGKGVAEVLKEFRDLRQIAELLDTLEVRQTGAVENTKWSVRVKLAAPLSK